MEVGIRELKNRLSSYIDRAREGEEIVITDRGAPVAKIQGLRAPDPPERLRPLIEGGQLAWRHASVRRLPAPIRMSPGEKTAVDYVRDQRR